jgi:homoserine dehydrogenase
MEKFRIAILGCGTVGGGVAKIILEQAQSLAIKSGKQIEIAKILDLFPSKSSVRHGIPLELFCGNGKDPAKEDMPKYTQEILDDKSIDLVIETIGGSSEALLETVTGVLNSGKHLVTANKALLAKYNKTIIDTAFKNNKAVGFEASVCGAIPIIKGVNECFTGDEITCVQGIMNGTSNYILSKMANEGKSFADALKSAQEKGYAEADPTRLRTLL